VAKIAFHGQVRATTAIVQRAEPFYVAKDVEKEVHRGDGRVRPRPSARQRRGKNKRAGVEVSAPCFEKKALSADRLISSRTRRKGGRNGFDRAAQRK